MGGVILLGIGFIGLFGWVIQQNMKQRREREAALESIASRLDGGCDVQQQRAWGAISGLDVEVRFVTRGSGKHAVNWTEVDAALPAKYPLRVYVRKHGWLDQGKIDRGEMIDIAIGNQGFDDRFLVEAAPADVARVLFDERACSYLLLLEQKHFIEVTTERSGDKPVLRLHVRRWLDHVDEAQAAIEAMAAIAGRVRDAYYAVEQATEHRDDGSPYRPMLDDRAARRAAEARLEEVARIDDVRTRRAAKEKVVAVGFVIAFVIFTIVMLAAAK